MIFVIEMEVDEAVNQYIKHQRGLSALGSRPIYFQMIVTMHQWWLPSLGSEPLGAVSMVIQLLGSIIYSASGMETNEILDLESDALLFIICYDEIGRIVT